MCKSRLAECEVCEVGKPGDAAMANFGRSHTARPLVQSWRGCYSYLLAAASQSHALTAPRPATKSLRVFITFLTRCTFRCFSAF